MPTRPTIALNFQRLSFQALKDFASIVAAALAGNPYYASPVNPTMLQFGSDITDLQDAIDAWGPEGNRGSHIQHVALVAAANQVKLDLVGLKTYCENTTPYDLAALSTSGFNLRDANTPQGVLQMPEDFHRFISPTLLPSQVKTLWKKPLGVTINSNVKLYNVYRGTTPNFADATTVLIGSSTKRSYIDAPPAPLVPGDPYYYFVCGVNNEGVGVPAGPVQVYYTP